MRPLACSRQHLAWSEPQAWCSGHAALPAAFGRQQQRPAAVASRHTSSAAAACGSTATLTANGTAAGSSGRLAHRRGHPPAAPPAQVNGRYIKKRIHVRIEHVSPSRCHEEFLRRCKENDKIRHECKVRAARTRQRPLPRGRRPSGCCCDAAGPLAACWLCLPSSCCGRAGQQQQVAAAGGAARLADRLRRRFRRRRPTLAAAAAAFDARRWRASPAPRSSASPRARAPRASCWRTCRWRASPPCPTTSSRRACSDRAHPGGPGARPPRLPCARVGVPGHVICSLRGGSDRKSAVEKTVLNVRGMGKHMGLPRYHAVRYSKWGASF